LQLVITTTHRAAVIAHKETKQMKQLELNDEHAPLIPTPSTALRVPLPRKALWLLSLSLALAWFAPPEAQGAATPGAVTLLAPPNNASLSTRQPELSWSQTTPAATWFRLYITRNTRPVFDQWLQGATNWTPAAGLPGGSYSWWVQPFNAAGVGPWSTNASFTIATSVPGTVALISPTGGVSVPASLQVTYTWQADPAAIWYELYVLQNGRPLADNWFTLSNSVAPAGGTTFAVVLGGHHGGNYQWWVRAWSPDGWGPWSGPGTFTMPAVPPPGPVTLLTPANNAANQPRQPTFTWTASSPTAAWYYVYVTRNGLKYMDQWVQGTTSWMPPDAWPGGNYMWWVHPWNEVGYGPWSTNSSFTIQSGIPGAITLISPAGTVTGDPTQRYTWNSDPSATWYELYVLRGGTVFHDQWHTLSNSVADPSSGTFALDLGNHVNGRYQWWVRGWSPDGLGPWLNSLTFQLTVVSNAAQLATISAGTFTMGSPETEYDRSTNEGPQTVVTLTHSFWMERFDVTQGQYASLMGTNPSTWVGDLQRPVEQVSWFDATNYCGRFTAQESAAGRLPSGYVYRLPTEAEWEYCARAGTTTRFPWGDDHDYTLLLDYAWVPENSGGTTHPVGTKLPNPWGLYDMAGNVWEWVADWDGPYPGGSVTDPTGPATGFYKVMRGGSWFMGDGNTRPADRNRNVPDTTTHAIGFRMVLAPPLP
jgi:formylglycine-generating enzyme required for sulfatase activity